MSWKLKVGGKTVRLKRADKVTAVHPKKFVKVADVAGTFGEVVPGNELADRGWSRSDCSIFERAGWRFISPKPQIAEIAARGTSMPRAGVAREIFLTDTNKVLLTTTLATVKLSPELTDRQAREVMKNDGLTRIRPLRFGRNLYEVRVPTGRPVPEVIEELQNKRDYLWVEPNLLQTLKPKQQAIPTDPEFAKQWHHRNTGLDEDGFLIGTAGEDLDSLKAWELSKGQGVRIAIIDSGMQIKHPDLAPGIKGGGFFKTNPFGEWTFFSLAEHADSFPSLHHGTFCLGLTGARTNTAGQQDQGGLGIAPRCDLIAIACPSNHLATQTTLACAVHFAVEPSAYDPEATANQRADVISCSLDTNNPLFSVLTEAIHFAGTEGRVRNGVALGVPIFWAVSNSLGSLANDPVCRLPEVMAVGKYNINGRWGGGASGNELAFLAPGVGVFSTTSGSDNVFGTGTSFATPLAAGVAALVLHRFPNMTAQQLRQKLLSSCDPVNGTNGFDPRFGHGKLNAFKAVS